MCCTGPLRIAVGVVEFGTVVGAGAFDGIAGLTSRGARIGVPFWLAALARRSLSVRSNS